MSPRQILLALAAVLVVAGLVLGFRTVSANGNDCGSAFSPSTQAAGFADSSDEIAGTIEGGTADTDGSNVAACESATEDAKPFAFGGIGLGIIALVAGFVASPQKPTHADGSAKPGVWR